MMNELPLVSCIMPTYNRRKFIPYAIDYFLRQDYNNKELIIIDDGADMVKDLVPCHEQIRYYQLDKKITLGAKLNLACNYAQGEIIANWDDDDWYADNRLSYQVQALRSANIDVCGINKLFYYDLHHDKGYQYIYPPDQKKWLLGSSLCYTKQAWCKNKFADINVGMDGLFVWALPPERVHVLDDSTMAVHMIHPHNVSPKKTNTSWWHPYPVEALQEIMKEDWHLYKNGNAPVSKPIAIKQTIIEPPATAAVSSLKNIYACLVHENDDCILDLVRNLHYNDPSSIILLYNGGTNKQLFKNAHHLNQFGAVIHPTASPVKYGYLHNFALSCMQFAIDNFTFDSLTIVDSDQLAIHSGYSAYIKQAFTSNDIGMLSPKPKHLTVNDISDPQVWPTAQAFKEYELWKPYLQKFTDGENKFVYWTFWPSTVFSADAARDLVKLFKEDVQLQDIMKQTKIWATEEVILPTLVALLGYKIAQNPCSYEFVKFKKQFLARDVLPAFNKTNAYWMHPVNRQYNDVVRKTIRKNLNYYAKPKQPAVEDAGNNLFLTVPLLNKLKKIEGWLSDAEADVLIATTINACRNLPATHTVVEVGCYHGKSTVIFGSVLKKFSPGSKVYSIDAHDGKLGTVEDGLSNFPPSFNQFKKNIAAAGIAEMVEPFKGYSYNIKWNKNISLLLIDGLHDYIHVAKDFLHFSDWVIKDGYVAFHDYASYFPGVMAFVNELLQTGQYKEICTVETLIIIQKL